MKKGLFENMNLRWSYTGVWRSEIIVETFIRKKRRERRDKEKRKKKKYSLALSSALADELPATERALQT